MNSNCTASNIVLLGDVICKQTVLILFIVQVQCVKLIDEMLPG